MRLKSFTIRNSGPIKLVQVSDLSDVIVLAGPNGVGKTTINNTLLNHARDPRVSDRVSVVIEATNETEKKEWGKAVLDTSQPNDTTSLRNTLQRNRRRNKYQSAFLNIDSDRAIRNVTRLEWTWKILDPLAEEVSWDLGLSPLSNRYNDVRHSIFKLIESQKREIADNILSLRGSGTTYNPDSVPDVLAAFKDAFWQLLAPKKLVEVDVQREEILYEYEGKKRSLETLSSGEREVVNIVFDFILRNPSDCIIVFDEPELHLHPELSYKLLQTLSNIGERNQFLFSTHSPDIISASLENTVIFVTPPRSETENQAIIVHRDDQTHHALQTLGQSIGIISLGKKLLLIEGEESSLDKQTYGAILKNGFPEFVLVPIGGKETLRSFEDIRENVLNKTIWGVDFYLLCDRDAVSVLGRKKVSEAPITKVQQLPRYHLENYFLDEHILAKAFEDFEAADSWLRDPTKIKAKLIEIARSVVPYAVALNVNATIREKVGNVSIIPKDVHSCDDLNKLAARVSSRVTEEAGRVATGLELLTIESLLKSEWTRLSDSLDGDDPAWRSDIPGRIILSRFSGVSNFSLGRLKQAYLTAADKTNVFDDIRKIFATFR